MWDFRFEIKVSHWGSVHEYVNQELALFTTLFYRHDTLQRPHGLKKKCTTVLIQEMEPFQILCFVHVKL
jgi:hypothetical protein